MDTLSTLNSIGLHFQNATHHSGCGRCALGTLTFRYLCSLATWWRTFSCLSTFSLWSVSFRRMARQDFAMDLVGCCNCLYWQLNSSSGMGVQRAPFTHWWTEVVWQEGNRVSLSRVRRVRWEIHLAARWREAFLSVTCTCLSMHAPSSDASIDQIDSNPVEHGFKRHFGHTWRSTQSGACHNLSIKCVACLPSPARSSLVSLGIVASADYFNVFFFSNCFVCSNWHIFQWSIAFKEF